MFNKSFSVLSEVEAKRDRSGIKKRGLSGREAVTDLWSIHYKISIHVLLKVLFSPLLLPSSLNLKWCIPLLSMVYSVIIIIINKTFSVLSEAEAKRGRSIIKKEVYVAAKRSRTSGYYYYYTY